MPNSGHVCVPWKVIFRAQCNYWDPGKSPTGRLYDPVSTDGRKTSFEFVDKALPLVLCVLCAFLRYKWVWFDAVYMFRDQIHSHHSG